MTTSTSPTLRLNAATLDAISALGVPVPTYDRRRLRPRIVHIGVGGFHRAHLALYTHELAEGGSDWGIKGMGLLAKDRSMAQALGSQDFLYTLIEKGSGEPDPRIVGSLLGLELAFADVRKAAMLIADPAVAIVSLTITEAGYAIDPDGDDSPRPTAFEAIARGVADRRRAGHGPITILSCDNLPGNGDAAQVATLATANRANDGLAAWIERNCTFPNAMVDRITPVTTEADRAWLREHHAIDDAWPVVAEPFRQWVVEDRFVAGRPPWEDVGVMFTELVHDWERYKLRLLNAGHSCLAYLAALASITFVDEAMTVPVVRRYLQRLLLDEAVPSIAPIPGHPASEYVAIALERFANTGMRDQIARLCVDGTVKFPTFVLPTLAHQLDHGGPIERATLALAGWARYLGTVPEDRQSPDAAGAEARRHARRALDEPLAFLDFAEVFGPAQRGDERFRAAFAQAYRLLADVGPLGALAALDAPADNPQG